MPSSCAIASAKASAAERLLHVLCWHGAAMEADFVVILGLSVC